MNTIKNKILHIVENKKIQMIPKWKFILYSSLGISGLIFSFLALLFVISLILFLLSKYGFLYLPFFGFGAILHVLTGVPVILICSGIILAFITEVLSRKYTFSFRKPLLISLLVITLPALCIGFLLSISPFHSMMRGYMRNHHSGLRTIYERPSFNEHVDGRIVLRGDVLATTTSSITLSLFNDAIRTVYATTTGDPLPSFSLGDDIVIFGIENNGRIDVMKVRKSPHMPFEERREIGSRGYIMGGQGQRNFMMK